MQTFYLAGPMRGYPLYNFSEFARGALALRKAGYFIESPAEYDLAKGLNPAEPLDSDTNAQVFDINAVLKEDFEIILERCQGIVLLPGWRKSSGTCAEVVVGYYSGKQIWELKWTSQMRNEFTLERMTQAPQIRFEDGAEYTGDNHTEAKRGDRIDTLHAIANEDAREQFPGSELE